MIQVLIERRIADGMESSYEREARKVIQQTYQARGFISGETFHDIKRPNRRFVVSKWRSVQDWQLWKHSEQRRVIIGQLSPILDEPERVTLMQH